METEFACIVALSVGEVVDRQRDKRRRNDALDGDVKLGQRREGTKEPISHSQGIGTEMNPDPADLCGQTDAHS